MMAAWVLMKGLLGTFWGRAIAIGLASLVALAANNAYQRYIGAQKERVRITENTEKVGKARNEKSRKVREKVQVPGSFDRLLEHHCRDCD